MRPSLCINHSTDRAGVHIEPAGDVALGERSCGVKVSNSANLVFGEFAFPAQLSSGYEPSLLGIHVIMVVFHRAYKKMIRVTADWVVALMQHFFSIWDWATVNLPRISVGPNINVNAINNMPEVAVSVFIPGTNPLPASGFSLGVDSRKEFNWRHVAHLCHRNKTCQS